MGTESMIIRILRGRKGRISKWFVEVDDEGKRYTIDFDGEFYWNSKKTALAAARGWVKERGVKATFLVPTREGR